MKVLLSATEQFWKVHLLFMPVYLRLRMESLIEIVFCLGSCSGDCWTSVFIERVLSDAYEGQSS